MPHFRSHCNISRFGLGNTSWLLSKSHIYTFNQFFLKFFPEQFISFWFDEIQNSVKIIYLWKSDRGHTIQDDNHIWRISFLGLFGWETSDSWHILSITDFSSYSLLSRSNKDWINSSQASQSFSFDPEKCQYAKKCDIRGVGKGYVEITRCWI